MGESEARPVIRRSLARSCLGRGEFVPWLPRIDAMMNAAGGRENGQRLVTQLGAETTDSTTGCPRQFHR